MSTEKMPIPVKKCPRSHDAFVSYAKHLATCVTGNASFTNPTPTVLSLAAQAEAFAQANAKAKGGGPGVVADRNAKRNDLEGDIDHLVDYVRGVIKAEATDPANAATLILSAGLSVRKSSSASKAPLAIKAGGVPGEVWLIARAVARPALYFWEYSVDQVVWTSTPGTIQARTTITGLLPGQVLYVRFRAHTRKGLGDYSDVVKCRVP